MSALAAEWIGIHAIFGAFLLGAIIPHDSDVARDFREKLEDIVKILLLPAFFAYTGMRTEIGLVVGRGSLADLRRDHPGGDARQVRRHARRRPVAPACHGECRASLGILMNTRGLMELIVLNVGLDLGVISPELFAMMVIMALVTTIATTPVLHLLTASERSPQARPA